MNSSPLVTVLLPVFNAEKYIYDAIKSILAQTYTNFEFIIINDGSVDDTKKIILSFSDPRIKYLENPVNSGLIYTLNRGLKLAKGKYIARMDADDISLPNRFRKQILFMEKNKEVIVSGTQISRIDSNGKSISKKSKYPCDDRGIKEELFLRVPLAHPTVIIRKNILIDNNITYNENYKNAEDYKLWVDMIPYGKFANIDDVGLHYRVSDTQITQKGNKEQKQSAKLCRRELLNSKYKAKLPNKLSYRFIKSFITKNKLNLTEQKVLYLSISTYDIKFICTYIFTLRFLQFDLLTNLRIFKRFLKGSDPLI